MVKVPVVLLGSQGRGNSKIRSGGTIGTTSLEYLRTCQHSCSPLPVLKHYNYGFRWDYQYYTSKNINVMSYDLNHDHIEVVMVLSGGF